MPANNPEYRALIARRACRVRWHGPDDPEAIELAREARTLTLADAIRETLATDPPLTVQQRGQLADLLTPGAASLAEQVAA